MIRVFEPSLSWKDKYSVFKSLMKNNISGQSPTVNAFEEKCANYFDRSYGISVSNGSVSLDIALQSLSFKPNDEIDNMASPAPILSIDFNANPGQE